MQVHVKISANFQGQEIIIYEDDVTVTVAVTPVTPA